MPHIRDILNKIKWTQNLEKVEIWYIYRGAPNDTMIIAGKDIMDIGKSFLETSTASIPHHRIFKIICDGKVVFKR